MNDFFSAMLGMVPVFLIAFGFIVYAVSEDLKTTHGLASLKTEVDMLSVIGPVAASVFQLQAGSLEYMLLSLVWFIVARFLARLIAKQIAALEELARMRE